MNALITLLTAIADIAGTLTQSVQIAAIISALVKTVGLVKDEIATAGPAIQNIIEVLRSNASITPDQMKHLQQLDAIIDKAFDDAAAGT